MGSGKTTAAINFIKNSNDDVKFLYITPYLDEVNRIIKSCPSKQFKQPKSYGTKIKGIKYLFERKENIVSTHSLFKQFDKEIIDLAYNNNYILIMDEVADVIEPCNISEDDYKTIINNYAKPDDNHILRWYATDYEGVFEPYRKLCDIESIAVYSNKLFVWLFPITTFKAFKQIYILTYLFQAQTQKYYYDFYGLTYKYLFVTGDNINNYRFTEKNNKVCNNIDYSKLIHILDNAKMNQIGDLDTALSKSWYDRNKTNGLLKQLKNNCVNYFNNIIKSKSQDCLWTTFKSYRKKISGKGYTKGFVSCNIRATNSYRNRNTVSYLINVFFNPIIKNFFNENGVQVDEDAYALSEMLQWIWRSAIRDDREIWIYIPSKRMRELLQDWMSKMSKGSDANEN